MANIIEWTPEVEATANALIKAGGKIRKKSGRKFKSGLYIATVKSKTKSPFSNRLAVKLYEDDSFVEIFRCEPI